MAGRRGYGTGGVARRPDGRWVASFDLPAGPDGKRRRKAVSGATRAEALRKLEAARRAAGAELGHAEREPLATYLERWLDDREGELRPSTLHRYRQLARHAAPVGQVALGALRPLDLRALYRSLAGPLSPRTVGHVHRPLHKALGDAAREERVPRNVADLVAPPAVPPREAPSLTPEEAKRVLEAATADRYAALWLLALATAMRDGELLALRWADLGADGILTVRRAVQLVASRWVEGSPKSVAGRRRPPLAPAVLAALREHRERQERERRAAPDWRDMGLIFPATTGGYMRLGDLLRRNWRRVLAAAGVPYAPPHALRHSAISFLLAAGVPPHVVQRLAGHADPGVTMRVYAHATEGDAAAALAGLAGRPIGDGDGGAEAGER